MSEGAGQTMTWYRSRTPAPRLQPSRARSVRNWLHAKLPEPDVRGKTIVMPSRRTFPTPSWKGLRSEYHGMFSEFHSVLGALVYARAHGALGVRVDFSSPLYVEPRRGPNWWTYFFESAVMRFDRRARDTGDEVRLDDVVTKYGRYGGFSDIVGGATPYLYPMTSGVDRSTLHQLLTAHVQVKQEILDEVADLAASRFEPGAYIVGVHYRGTDATHNWTGALTHYRSERVPYRAYADEVRRALSTAAPRAYQVFVATDEEDCLAFMEREFGDRVVSFEESPRAHANGPAVHLDRMLGVSNYQKGKSALIDCLLLATTSYLVKGRSNLSDASLLFNPELPYSFYPDVVVQQP